MEGVAGCLNALISAKLLLELGVLLLLVPFDW